MRMISRRTTASRVASRPVPRFVRRTAALSLLVLALLPAACSPASESRWYRGNLHTHSLWSDGDDFPEVVVDWYRRQGYDFVALSDHNTFAEGDRWIGTAGLAAGAVDRYLERFGPSWVELRVEAGDTLVRLKTFDEYRTLLEQTDRFLIIQAEEITDRFESTPVHVNATNLAEVIPPQGGTSVGDVMQRNVDAVLEQRRVTGRPMFPHINHPNYQWAVTAEDIASLEGERFFEVYNGHPAANNGGDSTRASTDYMWDVILTERLVHGRDLIYGLAVDDAHHYHGWAPNMVNPGRGWIQVRSSELTADSLIAAMERGDFYASTGVALKDIRMTFEALVVEILTEADVSYTTEFIGTRMPAPGDAASPSDSTRARRPEVGVVLATVEGSPAVYSFRGDELYVRARIVGTGTRPGGGESPRALLAWTQPVLP